MRPPINRKPMSEPIEFALKPGAQRGDSAFLLNRGRHRLAFDSFPGRAIALAFLGSAGDPETDAALQAFAAHRRLVASEPDPAARSALEMRFPSVRFLWDGESLASAFGAARAWVVLDPTLRVVEVAPLDERERVMGRLDRAAAPSQAFGDSPPAPILALADVLEPELCRHLVDGFERDGGKESGFMQDVEGRSVEHFDNGWKRRRDFPLTDPRLIAAIRARIGRRVGPEIRKAFQMAVTRIERDLIARYDAETGGHFGPHRDDTGIAVAHRRFAVSINLNADFDGGEISFPEYGPRTFKAAPGAAIVFSASILHQVSRVTRGQRYVFLTFLFDEDAERLRQANLKAMQQAQRQLQPTASASA
jgi:predicted 2-oxoglutarate/Fe(II)-dependent dioxygenase YbiX